MFHDQLRGSDPYGFIAALFNTTPLLTQQSKTLRADNETNFSSYFDRIYYESWIMGNLLIAAQTILVMARTMFKLILNSSFLFEN